MLTKKRRTVIILLTGTVMNTALFLISHYLKLPIWLDTTGTIYVSIILFFPAGFVVGLINNTILSLFFYGFNSISYYLISAAMALVSSYCVKKRKETDWKFAFLLLISTFIVSIALSIPITLAVDNGIPSDYWGNYFYGRLVASNIPRIFATTLSVSLIKLLDCIVTVFIAVLAFRLTPKKIKDASNIIE